MTFKYNKNALSMSPVFQS